MSLPCEWKCSVTEQNPMSVSGGLGSALAHKVKYRILAVTIQVSKGSECEIRGEQNGPGTRIHPSNSVFASCILICQVPSGMREVHQLLR